VCTEEASEVCGEEHLSGPNMCAEEVSDVLMRCTYLDQTCVRGGSE
jgi:hypothetical protein